MHSGLWKQLTTDTSRLSQLLSQGAFTVNIEVIAHKPPVTDETESPPFFPACQYLMSIVADLGINNAFFVVLPEPLDTAGTFMSISHVISPGTLDAASHIMPVPISHSLQCKQLE